MIIGYGSQTLVSDLIGGIFIVFEDHIRVGDRILIDGFKGDVMKIGFRTTVVKRYNTILAVNNSKMVNVFNLSREPASARWRIAVPSGTDIEYAKNLLLSNNDRFQKACKGRLIKGIVYRGVETIHSEYQFTFVYLSFYANCSEYKRGSCKRACLETSYKILVENGIIPFRGDVE